MKAPPCFDDPEAKPIIRAVCEEFGIDADLLKDLVEIEARHSGSGKRFGVDDEISDALNRFIVERSKEA